MTFIEDARQRVVNALHDRSFPALSALERVIAPIQEGLRERGGEAEFASITFRHDSGSGTLEVQVDEAPEGVAGFTSTAGIRLDFDVAEAPGGIRLTFIRDVPR